MKQMKKIRILLLSFLSIGYLLYFFSNYGLSADAAADPVNSVKNAVVEINYGITSADGVFHMIDHASGVVISNEEDRSYILTAYNSVHAGTKAKESFCKKHNIPTENNSLEDNIFVVTKGDVIAAPGRILACSEDKNFCVIETDGGLADKGIARLGLSKDLAPADQVYALGFAENAGNKNAAANRYTEYTAEDVVITEGELQNFTTGRSGIVYLQHSALIKSGNHGGPLLNQDGYIVGINNKMLSVPAQGAYYSLPIDEVREVLDNYQVPYISIDKEYSLEDFKKCLGECQALLDSRDYKEKSTEELQEAVAHAKQVLESGSNPPDEEILRAMEELNAGKAALEPKMKTTRKVIIVLGVIALFLFICMIRLFVWKIKKDKSDDLQQPYGERGKKRSVKNRDGTESEAVSRDYTDMVHDDLTHGRYHHKPQDENRIATICHKKTHKRAFIDRPSFTIGSRPDNDFVIEANTVSRHHACIVKDEDRYYIRDLNSSNGTWINGVKISPGVPVEIDSSSHIVLADQELIFEDY